MRFPSDCAFSVPCQQLCSVSSSAMDIARTNPLNAITHRGKLVVLAQNANLNRLFVAVIELGAFYKAVLTLRNNPEHFINALEAITYRRMDFEEFRAATISPYQLEAAAQWKEIASCYAWQMQRWYKKENSELKLWLTNADMKWYKQENSELLAAGVCCNAASVPREQREKMVAAEGHKVDQRVKWITELKYKMQIVSIVQNKSSTLNLGPNVPLLNTGSFYKLFMLLLEVLCTNSINIHASINRLEVGQTVVISAADHSLSGSSDHSIPMYQDITGKSQMRREQDRLARMDAHYQKRKEIAEFELRREERLEAAEERMAKKRLKRQKKQREERKAN
ncbi:hypothetical protein U9M48_038058 [Paspalum notatum var. saurae]|uniref:Uncharacterized protein n=1 Tax=Paspalum notatum var. saurae TaxID=547442 RepID=A0AAQ3UL51_PASNO